MTNLTCPWSRSLTDAPCASSGFFHKAYRACLGLPHQPRAPAGMVPPRQRRLESRRQRRLCNGRRGARDVYEPPRVVEYTWNETDAPCGPIRAHSCDGNLPREATRSGSSRPQPALERRAHDARRRLADVLGSAGRAPLRPQSRLDRDGLRRTRARL